MDFNWWTTLTWLRMQVKIMSDPLSSFPVSLHRPFSLSPLVSFFFISCYFSISKQYSQLPWHVFAQIYSEENPVVYPNFTNRTVYNNTYKIKGCNDHNSSHAVMNQSAWHMHTQYRCHSVVMISIVFITFTVKWMQSTVKLTSYPDN